MRRRRSSLVEMGRVLLEATDSTIAYLKGGLVSVLLTSAIALVVLELLGAVVVGIVQWATTGLVSVPDALQLQLGIVTPVVCALVLLLSIANLLRLVAAACLRAARTVVASAQAYRLSDPAFDADGWPLPIGASSYYVVPTPLVPSLPTQPLARYHQTPREYYVEPWHETAPWGYQRPRTAPRYHGYYYDQGSPAYIAPTVPPAYMPQITIPYDYPYGEMYQVPVQPYAA